MTARKAVAAALVTLLAALGTALTDDVLSSAEMVGAAGSALAAFVAIYFVPNARSEDPTTSTPGPGDAGVTDAGLLIGILLVTVLVLVLYVAGVRV